MNATTINVNSMGIEDFAKAIARNEMSTKHVLDVLDARIAKRKAAGKSLIARVVTYRNELAEAYAKATNTTVPMETVPQYHKALPSSALPTDPDALADAVFNSIGPAGAVNLISRITTRIAGK